MRLLVLCSMAFGSILWAGCASNEWEQGDVEVGDGDADLDSDEVGDSGGDADTDVDVDADTDADSDVDTDADSDGDGDTDAPVVPWVEIVSPADGEVLNPVTFELDAGGGVVTVTLEADDWPLHTDPIPAEVGSHT